ncbi:kalirin-like isoform X2 [Hydractinia symbiolongicarpus]|nr:kalirin-like isoform X2 [Hydractinia symbiolongicarpus]XP_057303459.1 kalirin-like isoform X2 [Hydractinia symbiolongicarpus]
MACNEIHNHSSSSHACKLVAATTFPQYVMNEGVHSSEEGYCTDSDENKTPTEPKDVCNYDNEDGQRRGRSRHRTNSKSRRKKMEELKEMYKHFGATRGSNDLYQTMLDSYDDFSDLNAESDNENTLINHTVKRLKSVTEKEALMKRDLVLTELADTEKDYVADLGFIVNDFIPLLEGDDVTTALKHTFETIFANIQEIYKFHYKNFSEKIEDCLEEPRFLKETFCELEEELATLYSQYCKCKPSADEALEVHETEIDIIRKKYFPDRKLSIKDYLVKPVQRLMKYQLLLTTIKQYSLKADMDVSFIEEALVVMERVPKIANDAMHVELIHGYEGFLPSEDLIYQDSLDVVIGRGKAKPKTMRIFIFEKVVVFTETIKRLKKLPLYKCLAHGKTSRMGITETVDNDPLKFAIWFRKYKSTDIYVCHAESLDTKEHWVQVLKDVIAIQAILQNRCSRRNKALNESMRTELNGRLLSQHHSDIVREETLRQALQGHPRLGVMSEKLKDSIERYIITELMDADYAFNCHTMLQNYKNRQRSKSLNASSLVSEEDMRPRCRPRSASCGLARRPLKDKTVQSSLVKTVSNVSFHQLDA